MARAKESPPPNSTNTPHGMRFAVGQSRANSPLRQFTGSMKSTTAAVMAMFDHVTESSLAGIRKPEPEFYRRALAAIDIEAGNAVFLDDLGINLKPARAMGMTTIAASAEWTAPEDERQQIERAAKAAGTGELTESALKP